jgi:branched-chain amino acid transport system substrate-binding protein
MLRPNLRKIAAPALAVSLSMGVAVVGLTAGSASAGATPGVTATKITIGATVPLTGIASLGYNEVAKAANAVFKWVNAKGGVNHRQINYILKDDCYGTPGFGCTGVPSTATQTQALLATPGGIFATVGSLGTPTQDSVRNLLKSHGVPQLFVNSGSADWNNPGKYPMLYGWQPSYVVESKILGNYMKTAFKGQKVCWLGQSDDFGAGGLTGLKDVGVNPSIQQKYSVTSLVLGGAGYFTPFIKAEQTANCKVVFLDTIPGATAAALGNALALSYSPHWVISSVGADPITIGKELGSTPDHEPGTTSFSYLPASTDTNPWNAWDYKVLGADPTDFPGFTPAKFDGNMAYGIGWGVAFVEALRAEGKTVTRAGFLSELQKASFQTPALTPLKYSKTNHQGLTAGYIITVSSVTSTTAVAGKRVYTTSSAKASKVVVTHRLSTSVPAWLQ